MASIETTVDGQKNLAIHTVKGQVTEVEIAQKIEEYHLGEPEKYAIWDFSDADVTNLSNEQLKSLVSVGKKFAERRKGGKTALVVPEDLAFALGRMWETFAEMESFAVTNRAFRSIEEAKTWLGVAT